MLKLPILYSLVLSCPSVTIETDKEQSLNAPKFRDRLNLGTGMNNIVYLIHTMLLAIGLLLSCYAMFSGFGDFGEQLIETARAKMLLGLSLAIFSGVYAYQHTRLSQIGIKIILFPIFYTIVALALNHLLGEPFTRLSTLLVFFGF